MLCFFCIEKIVHNLVGLCISYGVGKRSYSSDVILRMALVTHGEQSVNYVFSTVKEKDFV